MCPTSAITNANPDSAPASIRDGQVRSACLLPDSQDMPAHKASRLLKNPGVVLTGVFIMIVVSSDEEHKPIRRLLNCKYCHLSFWIEKLMEVVFVPHFIQDENSFASPFS